jgi:hypothetical protein
VGADGLLRGRLHTCPHTATPYVLITAATPARPPGRSAEVADVVGWYGVRPAASRGLTGADGALHNERWPEPWHTALILNGGGGPPDGSFHLRVPGQGIPCVPFYEVDDADVAGPVAPARACWATYEPAGGAVREDEAPILALGFDDDELDCWAQEVLRPADQEVALSSPVVVAPAVVRPTVGVVPPRATSARSPINAPDRQPWVGAAYRAASRAVVAAQDVVRRKASRMLRGTAAAYLERARELGFTEAARFPSCAVSDEALHVLYHPELALLLNANIGPRDVLETTLHFNARASAPSTVRAGLAVVRGDAAPTAVRYGSETRVADIEVALHQLQAGWRFERPWAVTPTVYFLTEREWARAANEPSAVPGGALDAFNAQRIAQLPVHVRADIGLDRSAP